MSEHTPTPWFWPYANTLAAGTHPDADWLLVAAIHDNDAIRMRPEDAAFIVLAVNSHDILLAACERALAWISHEDGSFGGNAVCADLEAAIALARPS